jgi:hypothetical protein
MNISAASNAKDQNTWSFSSLTCICFHCMRHGVALSRKKTPILLMKTDKILPRHVCDKPFMVRFPDRCE